LLIATDDSYTGTYWLNYYRSSDSLQGIEYAVYLRLSIAYGMVMV